MPQRPSGECAKKPGGVSGGKTCRGGTEAQFRDAEIKVEEKADIEDENLPRDKSREKSSSSVLKSCKSKRLK
jgi:hypothetical protein